VSARKATYYSDPDVVREYDRRRFGRGGGRYVAWKEEATIRELIRQMELGPGAVALDCPSGTGRFVPLLRNAGLRVVGIDISPAMLELTASFGVPCVRASADALPLSSNSLSLWLMSRFAFHFSDLHPLFREAARVLAPGGWLLFDIYHWTPRSWLPGDQRWLGGRVHTHSRAQLAGWLAESGLELVREEPTFLLAPYLYGFMPAFLPRWLDYAGETLSPEWKTKSYIAARRPL